MAIEPAQSLCFHQVSYNKAEIMMERHSNTAVRLTVALIKIVKILNTAEIEKAVETFIAPEGRGRLGLTFLSTSKSKMSFQIIPLAYIIAEHNINLNKGPNIGRVDCKLARIKAPAQTFEIEVIILGARISRKNVIIIFKQSNDAGGTN